MPLSQTRRLVCPKCKGTFDYEFLPGGSLTAIRLGNSRYMRCPICQKFALFNLSAAEPVLSPPTAPPAGGSPPSR